MNSLAALLAKIVLISAAAAGVVACSPVNLTDLGIPNPFASNEDVPPAANPTTDASTYMGPSPSNISPVGSTNNTDSTFSGGLGAATNGATPNVASGSDQRPMDAVAGQAYDMIVQRAQATCPVPPLVIGFGRVQGGYNANVTCPASTNSTVGFRGGFQ